MSHANAARNGANPPGHIDDLARDIDVEVPPDYKLDNILSSDPYI